MLLTRYILLCILGKEKAKEAKDDTECEVFNEFQKVMNEVNKEDEEDDEKCQWFIVSIMRSVTTIYNLW